AVGDVSGKGISAAFYMTLTKGFLRSLTRTVDPPARVMSEINRLFWENVDRNHFISMIYGVFDMQARTLTFVRAGHNPILHLREQTCTALTPGGLALGLERGELFDRILEEKTVPLRPGDLFAFYTDGFTEARNHRQEEFGEERLAQLLMENDGASAEQLLSVFKKQMQAFIGHGLQHDDMTMVLVRITE
ncbi:serine/threonine-protein phosphatase, partial [bacterium]|nr:serine/threonine-protein phosphatase [bacterium]